MTTEREIWTTRFGVALVEQLGGKLSIESGKAWHYGRYVIHVKVRDDDPYEVEILAMEGPSETRRNSATTDAKKFWCGIEDDDPSLAARFVIQWLKSR